MKKHLGTGLTAGAFFLIGTLAVAQTTQSKTSKPREASSGQASGRQDQYGHASGVAGQTIQSTAAQRKDGSIVHADFPKSADRNSSHATASPTPSNKAMTGENPLYKDSGKSGDNPLYEGKDQANLKPGTGTSVVEYKDPEDMTTRYRPGNNKTTRSAAAQGAGAAQQGKTVENPMGEIKNSDNSRTSAHATEALQRKHIAGVKYEDRVATAPSGQVSGKGIQEKGLTAAEPGQVNKMAIKENGISSSKPKPKP